MSTRKPIFVRWAEEAEARQAYLRAGLAGDAMRTQGSSNRQALLPSWLRAWYPCSPTSVPVKKVRKQMTPTVPPATASAPEPSPSPPSATMGP